ncbi:MAG: lipocalin family protein [Defluviimonas sp.]|uniref:lipocalin family protein n=1 Tax=Albidovulum sp. TaxID=1872424 RepID=UPI001D566C22|nr:lipocalin family protein [Paracoccaceae bacterium]MCC0063577.1 lipocalin family protein [Defluviimonas sp.]
MSLRSHLIGLCAALALAGCEAGAPTGNRNAAAPISSAVAFEPARFGDVWQLAASLGDEARCGPLAETWVLSGPGRYDVTGTYCGPMGARAFAASATVTGPGRITRSVAGRREELWVLWVDADYRVAVIGTPSGAFARVLSRTPTVRPDLLEAARRVLAFNGYDPAALVTP